MKVRPSLALLLIMMTGNCVRGQQLSAATGAGASFSADAATVKAQSAQTVPLPSITLQGIMVLTGKPQVLFIVLSPPLPGQPAPPEEHFILNEGDRQGGIEVKKIDLKNNTVTFDNHQVIQRLDLMPGPSLNTAQGLATGPVAGNLLGDTNRHRLVRRQNLTDDSRALVAPAPDQVPIFDRFSGTVSFPSGALAGTISQSADNSQKSSTISAAPSTTPGAYASTQIPSQPPQFGIPPSEGDDADLTPAELAEKDNAAGGDVPPPPAVTGN